jgi:membrane dipeptidase
MPSNLKRYQGYRSYQYLEAGVDYQEIPLAKEVGRVPPYHLALSPEQVARVDRIFEQHPIVSLHEHLFVAPEDLSRFREFRRQGRDFTGYLGLSQSGLDAVFDNLMDGTAMITSKAGWKWDDVLFDLGMRLSDIAHQDMVVLGLTTDDILKAKAHQQVAFIPSLEASTMIENELDRLDILYGFGVRCIGIAYSEGNALGAGLRERRDGGLTEFGRAAVRRMNRLGLAIDVSHSGDQTSLDTIAASEKPVLITHAGARALWDSNRLKPDSVLKTCAERGGVIGIEAAPHTTLTKAHSDHSIASFLEHVAYCIDLVGIDHVALGPDTLFGDHVGLHHALAGELSIKQSHGNAAFQEVPYVDGLENPGEAFRNIVGEMVKRGYSDGEIAKIAGGNVLRALKQIWAR